MSEYIVYNYVLTLWGRKHSVVAKRGKRGREGGSRPNETRV